MNQLLEVTSENLHGIRLITRHYGTDNAMRECASRVTARHTDIQIQPAAQLAGLVGEGEHYAPLYPRSTRKRQNWQGVRRG